VPVFAPEVTSRNANKRAISIGGMDKKVAAPTDIPIHSHKGVKNDGFEEEKREIEAGPDPLFVDLSAMIASNESESTWRLIPPIPPNPNPPLPGAYRIHGIDGGDGESLVLESDLQDDSVLDSSTATTSRTLSTNLVQAWTVQEKPNVDVEAQAQQRYNQLLQNAPIAQVEKRRKRGVILASLSFLAVLAAAVGISLALTLPGREVTLPGREVETPNTKCSFCFGGMTPPNLETLMINDSRTCLSFMEEQSALGANADKPECMTAQSIAWMHCGCTATPPKLSNSTCNVCQEMGKVPVGVECTNFDSYLSHVIESAAECDKAVVTMYHCRCEYNTNSIVLENAASDGASLTLSPSGKAMAVMDSRLDVGIGEESTVVRVYQEEEGIWSLLGNSIDVPSTNTSLSLVGTRLAVGSVGSNAGVTVYEFQDNVWRQVGDTIEGEGWTVALALEGSVLAVEEADLVQLYHYNGNEWVPKGAEVPTDSVRTNSASAYSRMTISSDGKTLLVDQSVYQFSDDLDFYYDGVQPLPESSPPDTPVSMSRDGQVLAISHPRSSANETYSGRVTVFRFNGTGWNQEGNAMFGDAANDRFGWSHSLSGDGRRIVIMNNPLNAESIATVYSLQGSAWIPVIEQFPVVFNDGKISISEDGSRVVIGGEGNIVVYFFPPT
jgi:hypothetical protein